VLGKIFGCKTEKIIGGSGKLHNEGVHYFNSSLNVLVIKSWRIRWTRRGISEREEKVIQNFGGKTRRKDGT
jgi:hypothetical protein